MECPVCYRGLSSKSSRSTVTLECGHSFCAVCAESWVLTQMKCNCPMCRETTAYFDRNTRSREKANRVMQTWCLLVNALDGSRPDLKDLIEIMKITYTPYRHLWKRPEMVVIFRTIRQRILEAIAYFLFDRNPKNWFVDMVEFVGNENMRVLHEICRS